MTGTTGVGEHCVARRLPALSLGDWLEFEGSDEVLDDLVKLLSEDADRKSHRWLREVTRLRHGARAMEALTRERSG